MGEKEIYHLMEIDGKRISIVITSDRTIVSVNCRGKYISDTFEVTRYVSAEVHIKDGEEEKVIPIETHDGYTIYTEDDMKKAVQMVSKSPIELLKNTITALEQLKTLVNRLKENAYRTTEIQVEFEEA